MTDPDKPDLDAMSDEEIRAWSAAQYARSRKAFEGQPLPEISRAKAEDYPHWEAVGWALKVSPGRPVHVRFGRVDAAVSTGHVVGLRRVDDGAGPALVVDLAREGVWALRRADGEVWTDDLSVPSVRVGELDTPVLGWTLDGAPVSPDAVLNARERIARAWIRTAQLEGDR